MWSVGDHLQPVEHVSAVLEQIASEHDLKLVITKRAEKRVNSIEVVRGKRDARQQELAFGSRPFVLCGLPVRQLAQGTTKYVRRNGRFLLEVIGHPDYGVPFGQDRLIPLWVASAAVRQKSRTIQFRSAAEILKEFDLPKDGPHYHRLVEGFKRVFASTIYFGTEHRNTQEVTWDFGRFYFFDRLRVWYSREPVTREETGRDQENLIVLSEAFWHEIQEHPIPVDLNVVRGLANNPGALDLYTWLSYRCHQSKQREAIPLFGTWGLALQLGVGEYTRDRNFRKRLREWLKLVHLYWPECPARVSEDGMFLTLRPADAIVPMEQSKQRGPARIIGAGRVL